MGFHIRTLTMYKPKIYTENDRNKIWNFIKEHPFALISGIDNEGKQVATHVPLIFDENKVKLQGHLMKATNHYKAFINNKDVLVIFSGPNAYISASWYKNPSSASTWNYISVQVRGKIEFMNAGDFENLMKRFTLKYEDFKKDSPTYYDNLPEDYRNRLMKAIAGFEISIDSVEATFKLSQDKDDESFENILNELSQKSHQEKWLADEMQLNRKTKKL